MGIQDVRNAFLAAGEGKLRCSDCHLTTIQDGNNSQHLRITGSDQGGALFELLSGPFDPKTSPSQKAAEMARGWLKQHPAGFHPAPHLTAQQR
jgi:hypothetical protein